MCLVGRKIIRSVWFEHAYCGVALGFAKEHQTRECYVRCLLCKQDVKIASRGITTFWEHCRGFRHHRIDCLIRLRRGLPLRKRDGTLMSVTESDRCVANLAGEMVPVVEVLSEHERRGGPANRIEWQIRVGRESEHRRSGADRKCSVVCMLGC